MLSERRAALGIPPRDPQESDPTRQQSNLKELTDRLVRQLGTFTFGSFVPCLSWIDWICGLERQLEKTANDFDEILEKVVQDHEDGDGGKADFADVLLTLQRDKSVGFEVSRMSIKAIILSTEDQTENNVPESIGVVIRRMFPLIVTASPAT
ncbi:hypothetical protein Bca52824_087326 [Brassica carinata]|uniref:Uncharacterized protein n=1 Tax=Brassica carinata TaxID=52824 RepID=A0A8X7PBL4_BRACI|nr:hypothetical protein Bca52824_087326 [Brassica carinata]